MTEEIYQDAKKQLLEKAREKSACADQYRRAMKAENPTDLLKVIHDNIAWCSENKIVNDEFMKKFPADVLLASGCANTGIDNTGLANSGDRNSGDSNSGSWNSGDRNSGDSNSGYRNSGYRNSGSWNSGDRNSGDSNSGYRNSGAFCTEKNPKLLIFDEPCDMTVREWEDHKAVYLMSQIDPTIWVPSDMMSAEEKQRFPKHETTEGYLKTISIKEAWQNAWGNWDDETRKVFTSLPNFNPAKFEQITGVRV